MPTAVSVSLTSADAAWIRLAFEQATENIAKIFQYRTGKLPKDWRPSREDVLILEQWDILYEAVRDNQGHAEVFGLIQRQQDRIDELEKQSATLHSKLPIDPVVVALDCERPDTHKEEWPHSWSI